MSRLQFYSKTLFSLSFPTFLPRYSDDVMKWSVAMHLFTECREMTDQKTDSKQVRMCAAVWSTEFDFCIDVSASYEKKCLLARLFNFSATKTSVERSCTLWQLKHGDKKTPSSWTIDSRLNARQGLETFKGAFSNPDVKKRKAPLKLAPELRLALTDTQIITQNESTKQDSSRLRLLFQQICFNSSREEQSNSHGEVLDEELQAQFLTVTTSAPPTRHWGAVNGCNTDSVYDRVDARGMFIVCCHRSWF